MDYSGLKGKVVLISGASGTIGSEAAAAFAPHGVKLSLTGRSAEKLAKTVEKCTAAGINPNDVITIPGDITKTADVENIISTTVKKFSGIDILVNCAGIVRPGNFLNTKNEDYDDVLRTNCFGLFSLTKAAASSIIERKGNIVNVGSFTGIRPSYTYFAYQMAEAAVDQFTRGLALELGPRGVRVNSVNPGIIRDSDFWTREGAPLEKCKENYEQLQKDIIKYYPLGRITEVRDVVGCIVFLASENASFVTGNCMPVDGGKILTSKAARDDAPTFKK